MWKFQVSQQVPVELLSFLTPHIRTLFKIYNLHGRSPTRLKTLQISLGSNTDAFELPC